MKKAIFVFTMLAFVGLLPAANCTAGQVTPIVNGVIDIVDAECAQAATQPEPGWVYFVCTVANAAGNTVPSFTAKVPANQALEFAVRYRPKGDAGK